MRRWNSLNKKADHQLTSREKAEKVKSIYS